MNAAKILASHERLRTMYTAAYTRYKAFIGNPNPFGNDSSYILMSTLHRILTGEEFTGEPAIDELTLSLEELKKYESE